MKWIYLILIFALSSNNQYKIVYKIDAKSRLFLTGKTSINNYECVCKDDFPSAIISIKENESGSVNFNNAVLLVKTSLLSCKNKLMNRDMHKALKAQEHPFITIVLHDAAAINKLSTLSPNTWYKFNTNITLTIAGVSRKVPMHVEVNKHSNHLFQLKASKELLMSDYHVKPRTPFNMIKIEDKVTINFDMTVVVNVLP
jgi:hypothetical protein